MRHPGDGTLRRLVDEPAGVTDAERDHVAACPACLAELAAARHDAAAVGAALQAEPVTDLDASWRRLSAAVTTERPAAQPATVSRPGAATSRPGARRWRSRLRHPVVAGVGVAVLLAGGGAAAATDWFQAFRTEQVAPLSVTQADLVAIPDLSAYGDLAPVSEPRVRSVPDAAAAQEATGLVLPDVGTLPRGVTGAPTYQVADQVSAVFTYSAEEAARTAAEAGETLPAPPPGMDGARIRLSAGPGVAAVWQSGSGAPALLVGRAVAPTADSAGVDFATARDHLLSLPGLPADLAEQLRAFSEDGTLPIPVLSGAVESSTTEVGGNPATVLTDRDGLVSGVVWVSDGVMTAVAGTLDTDEVLAVARDLGGR